MKIRLPEDLKARIEDAAKEAGRSMNAEIVFMLQSYFRGVDEQAEELGVALNAARNSNEFFGLKDPVDRAAILRVLLLEELMLLKRRVSNLGGAAAVLELPKGEIAKSLQGPKIKGTHNEQVSHFSQIVGGFPLSALLTNDELERLADRVVAVQDANEAVRAKK